MANIFTLTYVKDEKIAVSETSPRKRRFLLKTGNTDNQTVTKQKKTDVFHFSPLSPNDTPVKPKREAD